MSFGSLPEFFAMGGHGLYVWLSYGAALLVVFFNAAWVRFARRRYLREAADRTQRSSAAMQAAQETESGRL
jgi:heme exporter protein D